MHQTLLRHEPYSRKHRPANGSIASYTEIEVIRTKVKDMPLAEDIAQGHKFKRQARHQRIVKNIESGRGVSKYPFGKMSVGNSLFVPIFIRTLEEIRRVQNCVHSASYYHVSCGKLPASFTLSSVYSIKDGVYGLAFFRIA